MDVGGPSGYGARMQATILRTLEIPPKMATRLQELAEQSGNSPSEIVHRAIEAYLDDIEDYIVAGERERSFVPGSGIPLHKILTDLDLDD